VFDMRNTNSVLTLANTTNYEQRVLNTNDIPNKKYITDYVAATGGTADVSHIQYPASAPIGSEQTSVVTSSATIDFSVNEILKARVSASGLSADNVLIAGDSIKDVGSNNLELRATNNGVEVKAVLNLDTVESLTGSYDVTNAVGITKIYASTTEGPGRTGLYFVNNTTYGANSYNSDELVSKNRAVLLSILL
jgi:hypothetical protein